MRFEQIGQKLVWVTNFDQSDLVVLLFGQEFAEFNWIDQSKWSVVLRFTRAL